MVMYANKFKTKENKILTEDENKLNHNLNNKKILLFIVICLKCYGKNRGLH